MLDLLKWWLAKWIGKYPPDCRHFTRAEKLHHIKMFYLRVLVEDPQDGTEFDCDFLDAIERLEKKYGGQGAHEEVRPRHSA